MRIIKEILGVEELKMWHPLVTFQNKFRLERYVGLFACLVLLPSHQGGGGFF